MTWRTKHLLILTLSSVSSFAQTSLSIQDALKSALEKHPAIQAAKLSVEKQSALRKSSLDLPKTEISLMVGQYNSIENGDNNITISQTIPFPTTFIRQRGLYEALLRGAQLREVVTRQDIALQAYDAFNQILYLKSRQALLLRQDSIYREIVRAAQVQYRTGEGTLLAQTRAESQQLELRDQLSRNETDLQTSLKQLSLLCQAPVTDITGTFGSLVNLSGTDTTLSSSPGIALAEQQTLVARHERRLEGARAMPDVRIGYFNQTLIGTQNVNGREQFFGSEKRFQGFEVGLAIPLWFLPHKARISAARLNESEALKDRDAIVLQVSEKLLQEQQELRKNRNSRDYYEQSALPTASLLLQQSRRAFQAGELDLNTLLLSTREALLIEENYLSSLLQYNQSIITIQYLTGNLINEN